MSVRSTLLKAVFLFGAAAIADSACASVLTDRLCGTDAAASAQYPTDASLESGAEAATAELQNGLLPAGSQGSASGSALSALDVPASTSRKPSTGALAQYCSIAGEAMRVSSSGTQRQAQVYLQTALRDSRAAQLPALTALTAYRLGLVWISGAPSSGTRGAAPQRRNGGEIAGTVRSADSTEAASKSICSALGDVPIGADADPAFSMLALDCASRLALESGVPEVSALASLRFARFALEWAGSSDDPEALTALARDRTLAAIGVAGSVTDQHLRTELVARLAQTALQLGAAHDQRLASVPDFLRKAAPGDAAANSAADSLQAQLALAGGDSDTARKSLEQAILYESARAVPVDLPDLLLLLAKADPAKRQEHIAAAYLALQNLRPMLPRLDPLTEESMFALHMRPVFQSAADAQLQLASGSSADARVATAQRIIEQFREAELQSAVGSDCLPQRSSLSPKELAGNEIILYPLLFDDRVELIYGGGSTSADDAFHRLPPNRSTNRQEVAKLVDTLDAELARGNGPGWKAPAKRLYDILIKPIESRLAPGSTLVIVPDAPLRRTPFAALIADDGRYLVQRTALAVAPAMAYSQPGSSHGSEKLRIVAASLARKESLPGGNFPALAGTTTEAEIAASNGHPGVMLPNFTRDQLVSALSAGDVDVLHLATHAAFNGRSDRAFIVANGGVIRLSELHDIIAQNNAGGDLLQLLVLSACETAVGDDESSMGLAGAAVQAGARSAIASLWQVDDAGTAELMRNFYRNYRSGRSRAEALRQAQLALIRSGGNNADPFVWSAFTLLGAWR